MSETLLVKISRDGVELGSYESKEAVRLLMLGTLKETDFYWHEGMTEWAPLSQLRASEARRVLAEHTLQQPPPLPKNSVVISTTANFLPGFQIVELKGLVLGLSVRTPTVRQRWNNLKENFRSDDGEWFGGKLTAMEEMCEQTRRDAYDKMLNQARLLGANAVISFRFESESLSEKWGATEILCYGTAVVVNSEKPLPHSTQS